MFSPESVCSTFTSFVRKISSSRSTAPKSPPSPYGPSQTYPESPPWYREDKDISNILTPEAREFFARYSGLEGLKLEDKICEIRKLAWPQGYYPSIGGLRFLRPILRKHPYYPELLQKLKSGATLLELGPGLGQDLRYLVDDGAPSNKMCAVDERPELWNLGYQLFNDGPKSTKPLPARFIHANLISYAWSEQYYARYGAMDIILVNQFFDTQSDEYSIAIVRSLRPLLKPGTVIVGYQTGAEQPFESKDRVYYNNRVTWQGNWAAIQSVYRKPTIELKVDMYETVGLEEWGLERREWEWIGPGIHGVYFTVRRSV